MTPRQALLKAAEICEANKREQLRYPVGDWSNGPDTAEECAEEIRAYAETLPQEEMVPEKCRHIMGSNGLCDLPECGYNLNRQCICAASSRKGKGEAGIVYGHENSEGI